ncbi:hypothetical protein RB195_018003 [Necator americanus]|uniref:Uncharacterized protein n=1 Tax=Necator americanus TaxID=51031 RepID=A0ABR1C7R5_NECAM
MHLAALLCEQRRNQGTRLGPIVIGHDLSTVDLLRRSLAHGIGPIQDEPLLTGFVDIAGHTRLFVAVNAKLASHPTEAAVIRLAGSNVQRPAAMAKQGKNHGNNFLREKKQL